MARGFPIEKFLRKYSQDLEYLLLVDRFKFLKIIYLFSIDKECKDRPCVFFEAIYEGDLALYLVVHYGREVEYFQKVDEHIEVLVGPNPSLVDTKDDEFPAV